MSPDFRKECDQIVQEAIAKVLPDEAVRRAIREFGLLEENGNEEQKACDTGGKTVLVAIGKAAWQMSHALLESGLHPDSGLVITKYGHVRGTLPGVECMEAAHPVPDENSYRGAEKALELVRGLSKNDRVIFLVSGGGSALFEKPLIPAQELEEITRRLLACGADITQINTVRKHLSAVKGGRFAQAAYPAQVYAIILSDILGDPVDMIAGGPAAADPTTADDVLRLADQYALSLSEQARKALQTETPKKLDNVVSKVSGSVRYLVQAAAEAAQKLGYEPIVLTSDLACEAREAGRFMAAVAESRLREGLDHPVAYLAGGETVVHLTGKGKGGRNQELALAAAPILSGKNAALFSVGSDGTDGPTDAAGGFADGRSLEKLTEAGYSVDEVLKENNAYEALSAIDGLIVTGPTGTNVNDVSVLLVRPERGREA